MSRALKRAEAWLADDGPLALSVRDLREVVALAKAHLETERWTRDMLKWARNGHAGVKRKPTPSRRTKRRRTPTEWGDDADTMGGAYESGVGPVFTKPLGRPPKRKPLPRRRGARRGKERR